MVGREPNYAQMELGDRQAERGVSAAGGVGGAGLAFALIEVPESAKYAGMLVGGYTGGSLNFVAVSQAVGMDDPALGTAALAAESLAGISGQRYLYWRYLEMLGRIGEGNNNMVIAPTEGGIPLFFAPDR